MIFFFFTRPAPFTQGSSLQEEILYVCMYICLSAGHHFFHLKIFSSFSFSVLLLLTKWFPSPKIFLLCNFPSLGEGSTDQVCLSFLYLQTGNLNIYKVSLGLVLLTLPFWIKGGQSGPCITDVTLLLLIRGDRRMREARRWEHSNMYPPKLVLARRSSLGPRPLGQHRT